jgi:hypothetical protein
MSWVCWLIQIATRCVFGDLGFGHVELGNLRAVEIASRRGDARVLKRYCALLFARAEAFIAQCYLRTASFLT